jgi:hypothetical protein
MRVLFRGTIQKFPGAGGWVYIAVPKKYTALLKKRKRAWGMYPITGSVGKTSWKTKLMMKKGGDFFVATNATIRNKENVTVGDRVSLSIKLQ